MTDCYSYAHSLVQINPVGPAVWLNGKRTRFETTLASQYSPNRPDYVIYNVQLLLVCRVIYNELRPMCLPAITICTPFDGSLSAITSRLRFLDSEQPGLHAVKQLRLTISKNWFYWTRLWNKIPRTFPNLEILILSLDYESMISATIAQRLLKVIQLIPAKKVIVNATTWGQEDLIPLHYSDDIPRMMQKLKSDVKYAKTLQTGPKRWVRFPSKLRWRATDARRFHRLFKHVGESAGCCDLTYSGQDLQSAYV